jgi:PGF-pre-PGF domain-containing protein
MRYNKILWIFISFFLLASIVTLNASAVTVHLDQSPSNISAGQSFDIGVIVDPQGTAITGAQLNILFNNSLLNINSITEGDFLKQKGASTIFNSGVIDNPSGKLNNIYGSILGQYNVTTQGTFIKINVTAINYINTVQLNFENIKIVGPGGDQVYPTPTSMPTDIDQGRAVSNGGAAPGGTSGENYTNIEFIEKYERYIYKNVTTSYRFNKLTNPIVLVNITGNTNSIDITTSVEVLKGISTLVKSPLPELAYRNINIWVGTFGYATPKNIKNAQVIFKVPIDWMEANNIDPDSIEMMRYDGGWQSLPTRKIGTNKKDILYESGTIGFSFFAITGKKSTGQIDYQLYRNSQTALNLESQEQEIANNDPENTQIPPEKVSNFYNFIGAFAGILTGSIVVYKIRLSKKR